MKRTATNALPPSIPIALPPNEMLPSTQASDATRASNAIAAYDPEISIRSEKQPNSFSGNSATSMMT